LATSVFVFFSAARTIMESGERNGPLPVRGDREVDDCDGTNGDQLPTSTTAADEQVGGGACPWLARVCACTPTLATRHVVRVC
jgi:hypothetical protein